jgi:hypothetical protein
MALSPSILLAQFQNGLLWSGLDLDYLGLDLDSAFDRGQSQGLNRPDRTYVTRLFRRYSLIVNGVFKSGGSQSVYLGLFEYPNNDGFASGPVTIDDARRARPICFPPLSGPEGVPSNVRDCRDETASKSSDVSLQVSGSPRAWAFRHWSAENDDASRTNIYVNNERAESNST